MNKTKLIIWLSATLMVVIGFSLIFYWISRNSSYSEDIVSGGKNTTSSSAAPKSKVETLLQKDCGNLEKDALIGKAIKNNDIYYCRCINEASSEKQCEEKVLDMNYYNEGIKQFNDNLCQKIKDTDIKNDCSGIVKSGTDYVKKQDPISLAQSYLNANNYDAAISTLEEANKNVQNNATALNLLALSYANKALAEHKESSLIPKALELSDRSIIIDAKNADSFRIRGYIYEIKPDTQKAESNYNQALKLDDKNILAYVGRAHVNNILGLLTNALNDYKKAKDLDKERNYSDIYSSLCRLESTNHLYLADAVENCQLVIKMGSTQDVNKIEAYGVLSEIYIRMNRLNEAMDNLKIAQTIEPENTNVLVSMADINIRQNDFKTAERLARQAISKDVNKASAYKMLAESLLGLKQIDEAVKQLLTGLEKIDGDVSLLSPNKPNVRREIYYDLAAAYHMQKNSDKENYYAKLGDNINK